MLWNKNLHEVFHKDNKQNMSFSTFKVKIKNNKNNCIFIYIDSKYPKFHASVTQKTPNKTCKDTVAFRECKMSRHWLH